jgi:hypothetical protein
VADQKDTDREVLTSLPRSRPVRRSAKRGERAAAGSTTATRTRPADGAAPKPRAKPKAADAKPKAAEAKPKAAEAKPKAGPASAKAGPARPKAGAATSKAADGAQGAKVPPPRKVPPAGYAAPAGGDPDSSPPGPTEILSTAIQAASELAQIGFSVGRQALQAALERLPKP